MIRPQPRSYMCGSVRRASRNGASSMIVRIGENRAGVELVHRRDVLQAGVVDQHVHLGGQGVDRIEVRQVADDGLDARDVAGQCLHARPVEVDGQDGGAVGGHPAGDGGTDAAGCARDKSGTAGQRTAGLSMRHGGRP